MRMGEEGTKEPPGIPEPSPAGQVPPTHRTTILPHGNPGAKFLARLTAAQAATARNPVGRESPADDRRCPFGSQSG